MLPQEIFKIRHSEIVSEVMFGPKKTTRIVVSVAREAIEPNCQKRTTHMLLRSLNSLIATLNACRLKDLLDVPGYSEALGEDKLN